MDDILSRTLITGAQGMTGSYVDFGIKTNHTTLDITNLEQILEFCEIHKPKVILHLAAETNVDRCEKEPEHAYIVNAVGTYNMALAAQKYDAKLVYVSTAGVFDGEKTSAYIDADNDTANPQNHYSRSKYIGELLIKKTLSNYLILRAGWLFGGGPTRDHKFVGKVLAALTKPETQEIKAVNDTKGSPTFSKDLINGIKELIKQDKTGTYLLGNRGHATRFEIAQCIVQNFKPSATVTAVDSSAFQLDVKRINSEAINVQFNFMRSWQEALKDYIETEWISPNNT